MDVHQALDWVNALSEAESDGGEVSGLSDVSWVIISLPLYLIHVQVYFFSPLYNSIIYHCTLKISAFL